MNKATRKHVWPAALALALGLVGALALFAALSPPPGNVSHAQDNPLCDSPLGALLSECQSVQTLEPTLPPPTPEPAEDGIESSSTSPNATVHLVLTIANFPDNAVPSSSIELYLEGDFQVPDAIDPRDVYFIVTNPRTAATNDGGRVYAVDAVEIDDDDHFGGDDDWAIRVFIPDLNTDVDFDGYQGPAQDQTVKLVFTTRAGIRNPSEAGTHSVGYSVLGRSDDNNDGPQVELGTVATVAKISLSDEDNSRGYELTVAGSGFNNGTSAAVYVLRDARFAVAEWWETLNCAEMKAVMHSDDNNFCFHYDLDRSAMTYAISTTRGHPAFLALSAADQQMYSNALYDAHLCRIIIQDGYRAGIATVGSDDKVAITFEVTVPIFGPGDRNYICMVDGEGRASHTDVEQFELEPTIRVSPGRASVGDTVRVFAQDFANVGSAFSRLEIANQVVWPLSAAGDNYVPVTADSIGPDGAATATFALPETLSGIALKGLTVRIDAHWGSGDDAMSEDTRITIADNAGSQPPASVPLAAPSRLTATPGSRPGTVDLTWAAPANAQYHFVAWIPSGVRDFNQASILPVAAAGRATISGLRAGTTYQFGVIAGRWEWTPDYGAKWSAWSNLASAAPAP